MSGTRALTELLRGEGAHLDPLACVEDISAEIAVRRVDGFPHSIGELIFHMNYWMDYDLRRIRGERPQYPEHNSESFPSRTTPADKREWILLREQFSTLLNATAVLADSPRADLDREIEPTHPSHREHAASLQAILWQLVAHNSYHIGQMVMIRRMLGAWPPRRGGDTW